jgi:oxygen-independent coproporphyrinogen-3 oxidase
MTQALAGQAMALEDEVTRAELPFEFMLNALRLADGFELQLFAERTGLAITAMASALEQAERQGLLVRDLNRAKPSVRGFDFLNDLQSLFLPVPR